jgi:two-component system OmpR family response regulator
MTPIRVLLVDDDSEICVLLGDYLRGYGIDTTAVADGAAMRQAFAPGRFELVILDLMLPGEDGIALCRALRAQCDVPIIMLTARGEAADRVLGLEIGADDYVVKPFDPRELVARIRSLLRRSAGGNGPADVDDAGGDEIGFESWRVNRVTRQLTDPNGLLIPLSNAEFRLLWVFLEHPRRLLTRDQLLDAARGRAAEAFDRSIDLLVSRLRQKLNDDPKAPTLLKTVRGEGYLFDAKVLK